MAKKRMSRIKTPESQKFFTKICHDSGILQPIKTMYGMMSYNPISNFCLKTLIEGGCRFIEIRFYEKENKVEVWYADSLLGSLNLAELKCYDISSNIDLFIKEKMNVFFLKQ